MRIVVITGDLDRATRDQIADRVLEAIEPDTRQIGLDLTGVTFMDCAGLTAILQARQLASQRGCAVFVAALSPATRRILQLTDTLSILQPH